MNPTDIARSRLHNQHISHQAFHQPEDMVRWLGAVQSQEYGPAKWSVGMRLLNATDDIVDRAFQEGRILRTHVMRPTWHFVTPDDIHWLLMLTGPRVHKLSSTYYRKMELNDATLDRTNDIIGNALAGGNYLTRPELEAALEQAGIPKTDGVRSGFIIMHAELDAVICSGPRRGKQFTYALLDERAPNARRLARDEALAELVERYFTSHGPAQVNDFVWWSGLTVADTKAGIEIVKSRLVSETIDGKMYWQSQHLARTEILPSPSPTAYILPTYDEYGISYKDRSALIHPEYAGHLDPAKLLIDNPYYSTISIDGKVVGFWKRTHQKQRVALETRIFKPLNEAENQALTAEIDRYSRFLGLPITLVA